MNWQDQAERGKCTVVLQKIKNAHRSVLRPCNVLVLGWVCAISPFAAKFSPAVRRTSRQTIQCKHLHSLNKRTDTQWGERSSHTRDSSPQPLGPLTSLVRLASGCGDDSDGGRRLFFFSIDNHTELLAKKSLIHLTCQPTNRAAAQRCSITSREWLPLLQKKPLPLLLLL